MRPSVRELPQAAAQLRRVDCGTRQEGTGDRAHGRKVRRLFDRCFRFALRIPPLGRSRKEVRHLARRDVPTVGSDRGRAPQVCDVVRKLPSRDPRGRTASRASEQCHPGDRWKWRGGSRVVSAVCEHDHTGHADRWRFRIALGFALTRLGGDRLAAVDTHRALLRHRDGDHRGPAVHSRRCAPRRTAYGGRRLSRKSDLACR